MSFFSENYRICIIEGCNHYVPPQNEVDIEVGIYTSYETPICEECFMSDDPVIQEQIKEANKNDGNLPF